MNKILSLFLVSILFFSCGSRDTIQGDKNVMSVTIDLDKEIHTVEVDNGIEVGLVKSRSNNAILTTDRNLVKVVDFNIKNGVLTINTNLKITKFKALEVFLELKDPQAIVVRNGAIVRTPRLLDVENLKFTGYDDSEFDLEVNSNLTEILLTGKSKGKFTIQSDDVKITQQGNTNLRGNFVVDVMNVSMQDKAEFNPTGKVGDLSLNIADRSEFNGRNFEAGTISTTLNKRASATVNATGDLSIYAQDKSEIIIYGKPNISVSELSDRATISKR